MRFDLMDSKIPVQKDRAESQVALARWCRFVLHGGVLRMLGCSEHPRRLDGTRQTRPST